MGLLITTATLIKQSTKKSIRDLMQTIINAAIELAASDIHLCPQQNNSVSIKFRIDGIIHALTVIEQSLYLQLIVHIKVLANLDITITNKPQDGSFIIAKPKKTNCRVNLCPTIFGQRAVIRLIKEIQGLDLAKLGLLSDQIEILINTLKRKQGLILTVGPTGSGKTVTLYSLLAHLKKSGLNIMTACDPVEIHLADISQTAVKTEINLDYPEILRTFLRQDPDVIMIGEIRDEKTLKIAIQAATTGHLVLSSIHTSNAPSAINRLCYLGLDTKIIKSSINLILAQRLVRKTCKSCSQKQPDCKFCLDGYHGVIGIYELLELSKHKLNNETIENIKATPQLSDIASHLISNNITNHEEITRVLGT